MLTDFPTVRNLLKKYRLWAKKRLGQNFLIDQKVLDKILETADIQKGENITEIGPGYGVLTVELLKRGALVDAIEIDQDILPALKETTHKYTKNLIIHNQHVLSFEQKEFPYKIVANIPYHLTSPILRKFIVETDLLPTKIVLLVQKEVGEKICNPKKNSILGLFVKVFGTAEIISIVPPQSFYPPPKVESAILKIDFANESKISIDKKIFFSMVKRGFTSPRKMLKNVLAGNFHKKAAEIEAVFIKNDIPTQARAEDLSISDWEKLAKEFYK